MPANPAATSITSNKLVVSVGLMLLLMVLAQRKLGKRNNPMPPSADHSEIYRGVPIWISGEYLDRARKYNFDAIREARDCVDFELQILEENDK